MRKTCLDCVYEIAKKDERVVFIGSDLGPDTLNQMKAQFPERFFMEGISEASLVGMASGLALEGKIPYINTISTFLSRRACEQIILDVGLHNVNVRLLGSGGGLVYAPLGPTHLATDDIALMRTVPNMTILAPCDSVEMRRLMMQTTDYAGPIYVRIAKGNDPLVSRPDLPCEIGEPIRVRGGQDALIFTTGITLKLALAASDGLKNKHGLDVGVVHLHTLKPVPVKTVKEWMSETTTLVTIEEHSIMGGLGSLIAEILAEANFKSPKRFRRIALPDVFADQYGSQDSLMTRYGITTENLIHTILSLRA